MFIGKVKVSPGCECRGDVFVFVCRAMLAAAALLSTSLELLFYSYSFPKIIL